MIMARTQLLIKRYSMNATIDKTLFYEIGPRESVEFGVNLEHIINLTGLRSMYL